MFNRRHFLTTAAAALPTLAAAAHAQQSAQPTSSLPPAIAALPNRAHEAVPITPAERQRRADKARRLMLAQNIAALVITGGTSLVYFTGIRSGQSERLFAWILPATGAPYIVCPSFEESRMHEQLAQIPDGPQTRIFTWHEDEDPYQLLAAHLPAIGSIALDERVQFVFADGIQQAAPAHKVVSAIPIVAGCRAIKSPAELALVQLANSITLAVYKAAWQAAGQALENGGLTNRDFSQLCAQGYRQSGVQGDASCQVGANSALPHGSAQPQTIREGQVVLIDDGCLVEGYQSDMSRSFVYGKPTPKQLQVFDAVHRAQAAALAAAHPGVPAQSIDAAARKVITDAGFGPAYRTFTHRLGHGIGMDMHEWPYLVAGNTQPLAAGMCFSDEPGIYLPNEFGIRLEDDWHLTEQGGIFFTPQSKSLTDPFA